MEVLNIKSLMFEITHFCNQQCKHCYLNAGTHQELYEIDYNDFVKIVNNFKRQGGESIFLTGGEPFARKDLFQLFDVLENNDISFNTSSNGILLNENKIKKLSEYKKFGGLLTSLLGSTPEEHKVVAGKDTFNKVFEVLELFDKYSLSSMVQVTLARAYIDKIPKIAKMLAPYSCDIKFTPIAGLGLKGPCEENRDLSLPEEEYDKFLELYKEVKEEYGEKILRHNLCTAEEMEAWRKDCLNEPLYKLSPWLLIRPNGEKSFCVTPTNKWTFGFAQDKVEIDIDDKLKKFIEVLKNSDDKIIEIAKNKIAVDPEDYEINLLNH